MKSNQDKPSFLDRGTLIALAIVALAYFGWMQYLKYKYPQGQNVATAPATPVEKESTAATQVPGGTSNNAEAPVAQQPTVVPTTETFVDYSSGNWAFQISSKGMGLKSIDLKEFSTRDGKPIVLGDVEGPYPYSTAIAGSIEPLNFAIEKVADNKFVGRANVDGATVQKTIEFDPSRYSFQTEIQVTGAGPKFPGLSVILSDKLVPGSKGSIFAPSYDFQSWYLLHEGSNRREVIHVDDGLQVAEKNVQLAALTSHYFAMALLDQSPLMPVFDSKIAQKAPIAAGALVYQPATPADSFTIKYTGFAGPKSHSLLASVDEKLTKVIDFGMFAFIAKPILSLMQWLNSFIGNWGFSIIVLTLIVRFLVLPFNVYSYKSMKVMQKIQPEMTKIRERYKDKPPEQRLQMNQEIMELMKRHKANPVGGCLPMLLQLPIFFALYQVLGQSIELYKAPFIFWIQDLSAADKFYVLPVLMGITLFIQQKITPTTMDPAQAKIMMWVPVIFSFFMISLPSGLTLYIFVSTLFGIVQQYIFMRDRTSSHAVKAAKA